MSEALENYKDGLLPLGILASTVLILSSPIYIYGVYKFWRFRNHLLIQKRFPAVSAGIILISFLNGITYNITIWLIYMTDNDKTPSLSAGFSYFVYGLTNLRLWLVYLRWTKSRILLRRSFKNHQSTIQLTLNRIELSNDPSVLDVDIDNNHKYWHCNDTIYKHWFCILLLTVSIIGFIFISFSFYPPFTVGHTILTAILWTIQIIITFILIIFVKYKKVNDGIGCLKETVIMLCFMMIVIIIIPLTFISESLILPLFILFNISCYVQGLIPLYGGLYYVRTMEGSLTEKTMEQRMEEIIQEKMEEIDQNSPNSPSSPSETIDSNNNVAVIPHFDGVKENNDILNDTKKELIQFIENYENYKVLKEYLTFCWAVENLLFFEKVSIINQIILKLCNKTNDNDKLFEIGRNKFMFLSSIYNKYESEIGDDTEFDDLKTKIFKIEQGIYRKFIEIGCMNQLNISFETRNNLSFLLKNDQYINKFKSFDDFLHLFDGAMIEVYQLILSVYHYNFRKFVQSRQSANNL